MASLRTVWDHRVQRAPSVERSATTALHCEEDGRISDIAFEVGFGDRSNFIRTFRCASGMEPSGFRRAAAGRSYSILPDR
jgi:AraC-like DNA-binding protein